MLSISVSDPPSGRFSDGRSAAQRSVTLTVEGDWLVIATETEVLARWPLGAVRLRDGATQSKRSGIAVLIYEQQQVRLNTLAMLDRLRPVLPNLTSLTTRQYRERKATLKWLGGIAATLVALYFLLPQAAIWGAKLVPLAWQNSLGQRAEDAIVRLLADSPTLPTVCADSEGNPLLARTAKALAMAADLHPPPQIRIYPVTLPNAFALPGNRIILTRGLLRRMQTPEQVLAVLAHETAHLVHADPLAALLQNMGWSLAVQAVFGAGFTANLAEVLPMLAYRRDLERRADQEGARYLIALGRSPKLLGDALRRLPEGTPLAGQWLSTHPDTAERAAALAQMPDVDRGSIALVYSPMELTVLRNACGV